MQLARRSRSLPSEAPVAPFRELTGAFDSLTSDLWIHAWKGNVGYPDWLLEWYREGQQVTVPLNCFDPAAIRFTYGDSFPAMRFQDGKPYGGQVYTLHELPDIVREFGLPQVWNREGSLGPERHIEAQIWDDRPIAHLLGKQA